jgi:hypothetical protein
MGVFTNMEICALGSNIRLLLSERRVVGEQNVLSCQIFPSTVRLGGKLT